MTSLIFGERYRQDGRPMRGGGGEVYKCVDPNLDRFVVVKFLREDVELRRMQDEVAALQRIRSKNVVQILDIVEDENLGIGIVSEFLPGVDLDEYLSSNTPSRGELLRTIYQLANGLSDIHAAGIVHRDLKPNNVKFGSEDILKIFDFNLARTLANAETDGFIGTYGFAAPEQYGSGRLRMTMKTDVFSLALIAVYLGMGGELPPCLSETPPNPSDWEGGVKGLNVFDAEISEVLQAALSIDPEQRPTAEEIRNVARSLLLRDGHRATFTIRGDQNAYELHANNRKVVLRHSKPGGAMLEVSYCGLRFSVTGVSNQVLINRIQCSVGSQLPDSCVIDLGGPSNLASERAFVTFDLSHPEVVQ